MNMLGLKISKGMPLTEHERLLNDEAVLEMQKVYDVVTSIEDWKNMIMSNTFTPEDGIAFWAYEDTKHTHNAFEPPPEGFIPIGVNVHPA